MLMFNLFVRSRKNSWKNVIDIKRCQKQIRILQFKKSHIQLGPLNNINNPKDYILVMFMLYSPKKYEVLFQCSGKNPDYIPVVPEKIRIIPFQHPEQLSQYWSQSLLRCYSKQFLQNHLLTRFQFRFQLAYSTIFSQLVS